MPETNNNIDDSASLKVDEHLIPEAHPGDINEDTDSEGMCVEE